MSFISIVARDKFITVVSDGLVVDLNTGIEKEQDFKKFSKIAQNQFVAYAGNKGVGEAIAETLPYTTKLYRLDEVSAMIHRRVLREIPVDQASILVAIGGVSDLGFIEFHTFSNNPEIQLTTYQPKGDDIMYCYLFGRNVVYDDKQLDAVFHNSLRKIGINTPNKIIKAQKELNHYVSDRDKTVNNRTFDLDIKL
ncbi:hypothetical protein RJD24_12325 [Bacillaceae bacterium IKA-2]|nr:hypothetical protein RJD24_12325 [Bacillaceae bacterium IKA-2]